MTTRVKNILTALIAIGGTASMFVPNAAAQQDTPQPIKQEIRGNETITTEVLEGTVEYVEGNSLVVKMTNGAIRQFNVPESRRFLIDGKELTVRELEPKTKLRATVTTTTTPITERTTTVLTGIVWWVAGRTVILTLPNGENRTYNVPDGYKFNVEGNKNATVFDLKKGMRVSAEKIVEEPKTEITSNTVVTGTAPSTPLQ